MLAIAEATIESSSLQKNILSRNAIPSPFPEERDSRPHEQRATSPRTARRMNHGFTHLYRHGEEPGTNITSYDFLVNEAGYSESQVEDMARRFPPLLDLDVHRHLRPKLRFLKETLLGGSDDQLSDSVRAVIPPQYFGARLERTIAPRHAFLVWKGLPHGPTLLSTSPTSGRLLLEDFLSACRKTKRFSFLCNKWSSKSDDPTLEISNITPRQIEAFDAMFSRGLMAAARDDLCQWNNTWPLDYLPEMTSSQILKLLIEHGGNPLELDNRGVSLLHWACGTGNLECAKVLLEYFPVDCRAERDGATPLHWAVAGANSREFGTGGYANVCRYLVNTSSNPKALVNSLTKDGNSPLHWAAWSGTLETVKFLIRNRADAKVANRNGCTVAHWAASGGNVEVCDYLFKVVGVDFHVGNRGGNTPLAHAVAFGRASVVEWLRTTVKVQDEEAAKNLARDFVGWTDGEERRQQVYNIFQEWLDYEDESVSETQETLFEEEEL